MHRRVWRTASGRPRRVTRVAMPLDLSEGAREVIAAERESVALRVAELRRQSESLHAVVEQVDGDIASAERSSPGRKDPPRTDWSFALPRSRERTDSPQWKTVVSQS